MSPRRFNHNEPTAILARNNAAATCVQIAKTTSQRRDGIIEPFQHLMRQLPNYDYAITPNYVASTLSYAAVTPKYAASTPKKNLNTFDSFDRGCAEKKVAVQTCE